MDKLVIWCNENVGFASVILSALTLLVSIIAVIVSLHTARLPYRKKLMVITGNYISSYDIGLHITVTNIGNRNVKIKQIGFLIGNNIYVNKNTLFDSQVMLSQGEETSQYYKTQEFLAAMSKMNIHPFTKIAAFVEDTEGTRYTKKLQRAYRLKE